MGKGLAGALASISPPPISPAGSISPPLPVQHPAGAPGVSLDWRRARSHGLKNDLRRVMNIAMKAEAASGGTSTVDDVDGGEGAAATLGADSSSGSFSSHHHHSRSHQVPFVFFRLQ